MDQDSGNPKPKAVIKTFYTLVKKKKMKDRSFTYPKIVKLINLYKDNHCLWDISSPTFRHQEKRQTALSKIAKVFNVTSCEIKRKIRSLRATYLLERRKVIASEKKVRDGLESCVYEPVLAWYKSMSFLDDIIVFRTPMTIAEKAKSNFQTQTEDYEEKLQDVHLEKIEEVFYDYENSDIKRQDGMAEEYLDVKYLCEDTVDRSDSFNLHCEDVSDDFIDDNQLNLNRNDNDCLVKSDIDFSSLKAERIRAETEYFRKKSEYMAVCIEKEKKMQPLLIEKLKLEVENLKRNRNRTKLKFLLSLLFKDDGSCSDIDIEEQ